MSFIQIKKLQFHYPSDPNFQLTINTLDIKQKEHIEVAKAVGQAISEIFPLINN